MHIPPMLPIIRIDFKSALIILLTLVVIVLSTCKSCQNKSWEKKYAALEKKCGDQKPIIKTDTVYIHEQATFVDHAPIPYKVDNANVKVKWKFDTLYIEGETVRDTVQVDTLANRFYTTNYYQKKFEHRYGTITSYDTVSKNNLLGSSLKIDLSLPIVTKTVEKKVYKAALYFGIDGYGNKQGLNGAGASILYCSPHALGYEAAAYFNSQSALNFRVSLKFPLNKKQ